MISIGIVTIIFFIILSYYLVKKSKNLVCLMYHNVFNKSTTGIIGKNEFEEHMRYITNMKLTTFKMEELEALNYKLPKNSILITFDDGYKNNYTNAFPILKKYNLKATIFLNTKYIENDISYLNWNEIKEMYDSGLIDFQMHTHSHSPTIKKTEIKGFFESDEGEFVKREYFTIFSKSLDENIIRKQKKLKNRLINSNIKECSFRDFDFTNLPIFNIRSQVAIKGYKLKNDFFINYEKLEENTKNLSTSEKKKYINGEFNKNKYKYFDKVKNEEFLEIVKYEILENKKQIEDKLNKKVEYLAYPWGHKYKGNISDIENLGVKGFVFTTGDMNSRKLNYKKILRVNGDAIKDIKSFKNKIEKYYK